MTDLALAKVTHKGQMTIPQELRQMLGIEAGDYVALRPFAGGLLVSKVSVTPQVTAEEVLHHMVTELGRTAESLGIHKDEHLDTIIEDAQQQVFRERYGE